MIPQTIADRIDFAGPCWEWTRGLSHGYGHVWFEGRYWRVHCLIWERLVGPVPKGLILDHLCRNSRCSNPDHLEPVTRRTNTLRGYNRAANAMRRDHCKHGHPYTPENTRVRGRARECRTCERERARARRAA